MKHLKRNLLIVLGVLILLAGGFLLAVYWQPSSSGTADDTSTDTQATEISPLPAENIQAVTVTHGDTSYTIIKNADGSFTLSGLPLALSQSILSVQFSALSSFTSEEAPILLSGREADFGLESPIAVIQQQTDAETVVFLLGAEIPGGEGHYFAPQNSDYVYVLSKNQTDAILRDLAAQKSTSIMTLDPDSLTSCTLSSHQTVLFDVRYYQDGDNVINSINPKWVMTEPYFEGISADRFREFLENFKEVTALSFITDNSQDQEKYFQSTDYLFTYQTNTGEKHTLRLGDTDENGNVYACYDQNGSIFTVSAGLLNVLQTDPAYFIDKLVAIFHLDDLASVRLQSGEKQCLMEILPVAETPTPTDNAGGITSGMKTENAQSAYTYKLNGAVVDETAFQDAYKKAAGILFKEMYTGSVSGEPILTITYTKTDGSADVTHYYPLDERNYIAVRSNGTKVLVLKNYLDDLFILLQ